MPSPGKRSASRWTISLGICTEHAVTEADLPDLVLAGMQGPQTHRQDDRQVALLVLGTPRDCDQPGYAEAELIAGAVADDKKVYVGFRSSVAPGMGADKHHRPRTLVRQV